MATTDWLGALLQAVGQGGSTYYNVKQQEKDRAIEAEQRAQAKAERDRQFAAQDRAFKQSQDQFDYGRAKDIYESSTPDQNFADSPDTLALLTKAGLPLNKRLEHTPGTATGPMALPGQSVGLSAPPPPIGKQNDEFAPAPGPTTPPPGPVMSPVGGMTLGSVKDTATRPKTLKELAMEQLATAYADKGGKMDPMLRIFAANNGVTLPTDRVPQRLGIVPDASFVSGYALVTKDPDTGEEERIEAAAPASAGPSAADVVYARRATAVLKPEKPFTPADLANLTSAQTRQIETTDLTPPQARTGSTPKPEGRPVVSGVASRMAELATSLDDATALRAALDNSDSGASATGLLARIGAAAPNAVTEYTGFGEDAKKKQAMIDRVKQVIGKALEGGVLRKEDELKYTKILPTIGDPPAVVRSKLDGLDAALRMRMQNEIDALSDAGYDASAYQTRLARRPADGAATSTTAGASTPTHAPPDQTGTWKWDASKKDWVKRG